jgi:cytochrome c-type biogenesis protein
MPVGLLGIFAAGILTVFTPCVLPLLPVYLSVLLGTPLASAGPMGLAARLRLVVSALLFSAGFILVFVLLGMSAGAVGGFLARYRVYFSLFGGLVILLFGLRFVGWLHVPLLEHEARLDPSKWAGRLPFLGAFVMGLVFVLGWTPCIGPVLGAVLTYTASRAADPGQGALQLGVFGAGFALPLVLLSMFAAAAGNLVRRVSGWMPTVERVMGVLLVVTGLYLMTGAVGVPSREVTVGLRDAGAMGKAVIEPPLGRPTKEPRMVEFYSNDCGICMSMVPVVRALERECGARGVDIIKVDVDEKSNRALAQGYNVRGVPTFVFLDRDGGEAARLVGFQTAQSLGQAMAALLGDDRCGGVALLPALPAEPDEPEQAPTCQ